MTMHMLPAHYTTMSMRKRKNKKKTKSLLAAEKEHEKFLKKMGVGKSKVRGHSSGGRATALQAVGHQFEPDILHQKWRLA